MRPISRIVLVVATCGLLAFAGYRVVAHRLADQAAETDPDRALTWIPAHPAALRTKAIRQAERGEWQAASATAGALMQAAPRDGVAWRVLAQAQAQSGQQAQARASFSQALALSPRDLPSRAWLMEDDLRHGRIDQVLAGFDSLYRYSPGAARRVMPLLASWAVDPGFADALAPSMARRPARRDSMMRSLQAAPAPAADHVAARLAGEGGLTPAERDAWITALMRAGRWGDAYAHWAGTLPKGTKLPTVFNGGFERTPSGVGFDWRMPRIPGVEVDFPHDAGAGGQVARVVFGQRRAPSAGLEQALLLAPGRYRLSVRMRADGLRTDRGLEWVVACAQPARVLGRSERVTGSFGWRAVEADFEVPRDCTGQWLRLANPAPAGAGQLASGTVHVDQVTIRTQAGHLPVPE